jgi:hypothetical protein
LWDVDTGNLIAELPHRGITIDMVFSEDGTLVATSSTDATVKLWDGKTGTLLHQLDSSAVGLSVDISPDGELVVATAGDMANIWRTTTGELLHVLPHASTTYRVDFSPDGQFIAVGVDNAEAKIWNAATGEFFAVVTQLRVVGDVQYSPDGKYIALSSWGNDVPVRLHALNTGHETWLEHNGTQAVRFNRSSSRLATASWTNNAAQVWDVRTATALATLEHAAGVWEAQFSPDENLIATVSEDGTTKLWASDSYSLLATFHSEHKRLLDAWHYGQAHHQVAFSPDSTMLAIASTDGKARYRRLEPPTEAPELVAPEDGSTLNASDTSALTLTWTPADTTECDLEIARDAAFADIVISKRRVPPYEFVPPASLLDAGDYYWRVRSVLFEPGPWSEPFKFTVETAAIIRVVATEVAPPLVTVDVVAEGIAGLFGYQAALSYDPSMLEIIDVTEGPLLGADGASTFWQTAQVDPVAGTIFVANARLEPGEIAGDGTLLTIEARVLRAGRSFVSIDSMKLADEQSAPVAALAVRGTVDVAVETHLDLRAVPVFADGLIAVELRIVDAADVSSYQLSLVVPPELEAVDAPGISSVTIEGSELPESGEFETILLRVWEGGSFMFQIVGSVRGSSGIDVSPVVDSVEIVVVGPPNVDVNKDYRVDIVDLVVIARRFNDDVLDNPRPNPDVNRDGTVDIFDVVLVAGAFGQQFDASGTQTVLAAPLRIGPNHIGLIEDWLRQARRADDGSESFRRGVEVLEQLLGGVMPGETRLLPNYPNPFNPETWIPFELAQDSSVMVRIYDPGGRRVRTLDLGALSAGNYASQGKAAYWDGKNGLGEPVASGMYIYELRAGTVSETRQMIISK